MRRLASIGVCGAAFAVARSLALAQSGSGARPLLFLSDLDGTLHGTQMILPICLVWRASFCSFDFGSLTWSCSVDLCAKPRARDGSQQLVPQPNRVRLTRNAGLVSRHPCGWPACRAVRTDRRCALGTGTEQPSSWALTRAP